MRSILNITLSCPVNPQLFILKNIKGIDMSIMNTSLVPLVLTSMQSTDNIDHANTSTISTNEDDSYEADQANCAIFDFLIEAVAMGIMCIFGFTGNTLSMICLWRDKSKTATPFLLVSLEVADTLFLVTVLLLRVITSIHTFTGWFIPIMHIFPYFGAYIYPCALIAETATVYLTLLVTVNRYISVCRPYEASSLCSVQHARRHVVLVCLFSIIYNLPRFFEYQVVLIIEDTRSHLRPVVTDLGKNPIYNIVYSNALYFIVMFLIPLVLLILLNYKLILALRRTKKKRAQLISSVDANSKSEDDITLVLIVVVVVFVVCQTPALVTQGLVSFLDIQKRVCPNIVFYYERISDLMVVANSSMNFIIYCFCSRRFRQILLELICKTKMHSPENSQASRTTCKHTRIAKTDTNNTVV